jgi:deoxyribodipyrimidine photolyase
MTRESVGANNPVEDNTALALASSKAEELGVPLVWLFVLSPGDYKMHDRSTKRIDFMLRNLRVLKVRSQRDGTFLNVSRADC